MPIRSREELDSFVTSLKIPQDRREVISAELADHVESAAAEGRAAGATPDDAMSSALASLGEPGTLRARFEIGEPVFHFGWRAAVAWSSSGLEDGAYDGGSDDP